MALAFLPPQPHVHVGTAWDRAYAGPATSNEKSPKLLFLHESLERYHIMGSI